MLKRFFHNQAGATSIEYALIATLIGVAIIVSVGALGTSVQDTFTDVGNEVAAVNQ